MAHVGSIGIDVGGTKTLFALFDNTFKVVETIKVKTNGGNTKDFSEKLTESVKALVKKASKQELIVATIGVGVAGTVDTAKGVVEAAPNIPALEGFSFRRTLSRIAKTEVGVYNDVNAALYGELKFGAAVGYKHVIGVFIGTGVGGAIAVDGKLYIGASGHAGDIGHLLLQPFGLLTGSSRHGVLDNVASRTAIAGEAATLAVKHLAPHLLKGAGTDVKDIKSSALGKAIRQGDKAVEELVRSRAQILGIALANIVCFFNPEIVVLGGGLVKEMPTLIRQEVAAGLHAQATNNAKRGLRIVTAKLKNHAVTTGAAKLMLDQGT